LSSVEKRNALAKRAEAGPAKPAMMIAKLIPKLTAAEKRKLVKLLDAT
jgi:hypothetical protein